MELCRSLALFTGCLGLVSILIALSTDFWFVAMGPNFSLHSGLWPEGFHNTVAGRGPLASSVTAFVAGSLSLGAHCSAPRPGYDTL
uniref:Natural killer cell granule protein 7 n=1 Tax=Panthera tigris altaica TaxID=74533 RepID=A0A8C9JW79_PANTA